MVVEVVPIDTHFFWQRVRTLVLELSVETGKARQITYLARVSTPNHRYIHRLPLTTSLSIYMIAEL